MLKNMLKEKKEIPIFFTIDDKFVPYVSCAISSITENSSKDYDYKINILYENLSDKDKSEISKLETDNCKISFKLMKDGMDLITNRVENKLRCDYFTLTIYFRIFIADLYPQYDKGIYIDSDVVVPGDISELYNKDLGDNIIGACQDNSIKDIPVFIDYVKNSVGVDMPKYINSGVLLMDLKQMREKEFSQKFLTLLNTYHFDSIAPDQDYINAICHDKILYLDEEWDAMPKKGEKLDNPKLIHYNLFFKPWCYDDIQYEDYFWKYAKKSGFYNQIVENKNNYSLKQKESDNKTFDLLMNKANNLAKTDNITFKKIHESKGEIRL